MKKTNLSPREPRQAVVDFYSLRAKKWRRYIPPGVRAYHAIRARNLGGKVDMDVHVLVDPKLTVREGHDIASNVRRRIQDAESNVQQVIVHVEPDDRNA